MPKPDGFLDLRGLGDLEWRRLRRIEDFDSTHLDFDVAGGQLRVSRAFRTLPNNSLNFEDVLVSNITGYLMSFRGDPRVETTCVRP
jgi:hypothetical protein